MIRPFLFGAIGYPALELLYRRRTHYSMALAGGLSTMLVNRIRKCRMNILVQGMVCGLGITCIEYVCGQIWNRQHRIWDYRQIPMNVHGQVCLPFSLLWSGLGMSLISALNLLDHMKQDG